MCAERRVCSGGRQQIPLRSKRQKEEMAEILGINYAEVQQAALIAVAYPRREDFKPAYREPVERFTHWNSW